MEQKGPVNGTKDGALSKDALLAKEKAQAPRSFLGRLISSFFPHSRKSFAPTIPVLHWRDLIEWFSNWIECHRNICDLTVGFTINEGVENGAYRLVQGVFNKSSNTVEAVRRIKAADVDDEVKSSCFSKEKVTLFT